jgi:oligoendopeptidase F
MQLTRLSPILAAVAALFLAPGTHAAERSAVPDKYKWDLTGLYQDEAAWVAAKQELVADVARLGQWQGKLGESAGTLLAAMTDLENASRKGDRLYWYAYQLNDQDTRVDRSLQMKEEAAKLYTDLQTATAFMEPEILAAGHSTIDSFLAAEPRLAQYRMYLDDILRGAAHTLTPAEEKLVARAGTLAQTGSTVHALFTSAELPYPEITLSTGEKVRLDTAAYTKYRASPVKADRDAVFRAFWDRYGEFKGTLASTLNAHVQTHVFTKDVRNFPSSLEAALFDFNIPTSVYSRLLDDVRQPADAAPVHEAPAEDHGAARTRL